MEGWLGEGAIAFGPVCLTPAAHQGHGATA